MKACIHAKKIITADKNDTIIENGYVYFEDGIIREIGNGIGEQYLRDGIEYYDYGENTLAPGFIDTHCFFTGYSFLEYGINLQNFKSLKSIIEFLKENTNENDSLILGRNVIDSLIKESSIETLDGIFSNIPIILINSDMDKIISNTAAKKIFHINENDCSMESLWKLLKYMISDYQYILKSLFSYMKLLNRRGITSVKDMAFDNYYGLDNILHDMDSKGLLTLRFSFMSQPVGKELDIEVGRNFLSKYNSDYFKFSGYNFMTDGSISQNEGDLKLPYENSMKCCMRDIDYDFIEKNVLKCDAEGFRVSLHAQGDSAVSKAINIFDRCKKDEFGKLLNRHCITDLELTDKGDFPKMSSLGIIGEIYPQIPSLYEYAPKIKLINNKIGMERSKCYWNRKGMLENGIILSCATDLPLLFDDIPESIYHSSGGYLGDTGNKFNPENSISPLELIKAWSYGGAYNLGVEEKLGSIEVGKDSDFAIIDLDILDTKIENVKKAKVISTFIGTKGIVWSLKNFK